MLHTGAQVQGNQFCRTLQKWGTKMVNSRSATNTDKQVTSSHRHLRHHGSAVHTIYIQRLSTQIHPHCDGPLRRRHFYSHFTGTPGLPRQLTPALSPDCGVSQYKDVILPLYRSPMIRIRWSHDCVIFIMGSPYLERQSLYWTKAREAALGRLSPSHSASSLLLPFFGDPFIPPWGPS